MRNTKNSTILLIFFLAFSAGVFADSPEGKPPRPGDGKRGSGPPPHFQLQFLQDPEVKNRLQLTDQQIKSIEAFRNERLESWKEMIGKDDPQTRRDQRERLAKMSEEERRKEMNAFRNKIHDFSNESQKKMQAIFTPEQIRELKVITFQIAGGLASQRPLSLETLDIFDLTDQQKEKIRDIQERSRDTFMELIRSRSDFGKPEKLSPQNRREFEQQFSKKAEEHFKQTKSETIAVLTAEQKTLAEKLTEEGKPIYEKFKRFREEQRMKRREGPPPPSDSPPPPPPHLF